MYSANYQLSFQYYLFFLSKVKSHIVPIADIQAWCLMPNHFHFLIATNEKSCEPINERHRPNVQLLSKNIGTILSAYTKGLNKEIGRRGYLFSHNTKAKCLSGVNDPRYTITCFFYIHQNPLNARLCNDLVNWEFSSHLDFANLRNGTIVNKKLAYELINFDKDNFEAQCLYSLNEKCLDSIW